MAYKGRYKIKNPDKYLGNSSNVVFRSLWERNAFRWCENNPKVRAWSSEEIVVPYKCSVDRKLHRYFVDLYLEMTNGSIYLIEIKPKKETMPPKQGKRKTKRYINEVLTFSKNQDKWEAADQYANHKGWKFQVWTEETLNNLGIKVLNT